MRRFNDAVMEAGKAVIITDSGCEYSVFGYITRTYDEVFGDCYCLTPADGRKNNVFKIKASRVIKMKVEF